MVSLPFLVYLLYPLPVIRALPQKSLGVGHCERSEESLRSGQEIPRPCRGLATESELRRPDSIGTPQNDRFEARPVIRDWYRRDERLYTSNLGLWPLVLFLPRPTGTVVFLGLTPSSRSATGIFPALEHDCA